jgi:hypothetical protein
MAAAVIVIVVIVSFAVVVYPFFKRGQHSAFIENTTGNRNKGRERQERYVILEELESDFKAGVLNETDYLELKNRYSVAEKSEENEPVGLETAKLDSEIERRVNALRTGKTVLSPPDALEEAISARRKPGSFCPQCGTRSGPSDRYCAKCGSKLGKGATH